MPLGSWAMRKEECSGRRDWELTRKGTSMLLKVYRVSSRFWTGKGNCCTTSENEEPDSGISSCRRDCSLIETTVFTLWTRTTTACSCSDISRRQNRLRVACSERVLDHRSFSPFWQFSVWATVQWRRTRKAQFGSGRHFTAKGWVKRSLFVLSCAALWNWRESPAMESDANHAKLYHVPEHDLIRNGFNATVIG